MGDKNPPHTLGDYSRRSHEGYRNTIELFNGNNVVPLRSDTIRLMQDFEACFGGSFRVYAYNKMKARCIMIMRFYKYIPTDLYECKMVENGSLDQKWRRNLYQGCGYDGGGEKIHDDSSCKKDSSDDSILIEVKRFITKPYLVAHIEDLALYDNESLHDSKDFAKLVKAIYLAQYALNVFDRYLIELENQFQCLMEAHLAPKPSVQMNKIASSCEICSGPHDTQYCMENPEQAFVDFATSRIDEAGGKWFTLKLEQNNLDKYVESLELGKNRSAFIQRDIPKKMKDPGLFILPCRLGDSKPFDTLDDLGSSVNLIPLNLFKNLKIGLLEETKDVLGLADGTKSYPVRIVRNVEVHVGKLKILKDFHVIDMEKTLPTLYLLEEDF
nr:MAK10-like protein [Tanacetum cinerariifolium]